MIYSDAIIVNAPLLSSQIRHAVIFGALHLLPIGKSLLLINDHNPKPLFYQLSAEEPDAYDIEYLVEGPEQWEVRLHRKS